MPNGGKVHGKWKVLALGRIGPKTTELSGGLKTAVTIIITEQGVFVSALPHVKVARDVAWCDAKAAERM
jgi:hypothetical protein